MSTISRGRSVSRSGGVLVLSASAGTGHLRAAEALQQALSESDEQLRVRHVDVLELAPAWVRRIYAGSFEFFVARARGVWQALYELTDRSGPDTARWAPIALRAVFRAFRPLLRDGWDCCLCTHFLPCQVARGLSGRPPFEVVATDFTLHRYWIQPAARRYHVATEALAQDVRRRAPWADVHASGIPVDPRFAEPPPRPEARRALGLDLHGRVVLVIGGGMGLGVEETVRGSLAARVAGLQVIAVCGRSVSARESLSSLELPAERLRVLGYVSDIQRWMAAADLVVTKPGGLTASEALAAARPLLLSTPIPGHEAGNLRALLETRAALALGDPAAAGSVLERVFGDSDLLEDLRACARKVGRPRAALEIAEAVRARLPGHGSAITASRSRGSPGGITRAAAPVVGLDTSELATGGEA